MKGTALMLLLLFGLPAAAQAATAQQITAFQETERVTKAELETKLKKREKDNTLKQQAAVKKFHAERVLRSAPLADINQRERDAMKPFEEERQKIIAERQKYRQDFIKKVNALNS